MKIAFDIGANRGVFTDYFLQSGFDKVIAVEAHPDLANGLSRKYQPPQVEVVCRAVSNSVGQEIDFWLASCKDKPLADGVSSADPLWPTEGRFSKRNGYDFNWTKIVVETTTIDELVRLYGAPNHIKLDVEGYESVALQGMSVAYCPLRFEWEEEKLDEVAKSLHHLVSIGYRYFGNVVEVDGNDFDQRPETYFVDVDAFIVVLRRYIEAQHQVNRQFPTQMTDQWPTGTKGWEYANEHGLLVWGMMWAFREMDAAKLKLKKNEIQTTQRRA